MGQKYGALFPAANRCAVNIVQTLANASCAPSEPLAQSLFNR